MKRMRKIIEIDDERCDGCGSCVPACAEGAIEVVNGKARVLSDSFCDGLGACIGECPRDAMRLIEREADEFDVEAVEAHLKEGEDQAPTSDEIPFRRCPSNAIQTFVPLEGAPETQATPGQSPSSGNLSHWPVQIRLIPPTAPFLKGADLLVTADCVPVAYPRFHQDFLKGKVVMMGCPKFDDTQDYVERFTRIFGEAQIRSVTVVDMEVPCCSAMPAIINRAMDRAGTHPPLREITISSNGKVLENETSAT